MYTEQDILDARKAVWGEWHQLDKTYWVSVWPEKTFIHFPWAPYIKEDYVEKSEEKEEEKLEETKLWTPRVITGGKDGGGDTPVENWLLRMEPGDMFFISMKNNPVPAEEYMVIEKSESTVYLQYDDHRGQGRIRVFADPFVKLYNAPERIERVVPFVDSSE